MATPELARASYIIIHAEAPSPSVCAQNGGNVGPCLVDCLREPIDCAAALTGRTARDKFGGFGGARDTTGTDPDCRSLQCMCKRNNGRRLAHPDASQQQLGLSVEQLKYFSFETLVAKCHAREMVAVEYRTLRHA